MPDKHTLSQFDDDLNHISTLVMEMGGLVESQLRQAISGLVNMDGAVCDVVCDHEKEVNGYEVKLDHEITSVISRRQPAARDLRLLMAMSRITSNLERAGDEAHRMARMVKMILESGQQATLPVNEVRKASEMASNLLRRSLDAFARQDAKLAAVIIKEDDDLDAEYNSFMRVLVTYIMEDPRAISPSINLLFLAKAIERVGDHAKNIAESTIYVVQGEDVRHTSHANVDDVVKGS